MLLFYYFGVENLTHGLTHSSCLRLTFAGLKEYDQKKFGEEIVSPIGGSLGSKSNCEPGGRS